MRKITYIPQVFVNNMKEHKVIKYKKAFYLEVYRFKPSF